MNPEKAPQALLRSLGEDLSSHTQHPSKQLGIIMHAKNSVLERTGKQESLLGLLTTNLEKTFIIQSSNEENKQEKERQLDALTYLNVIDDTKKERDAKGWPEEDNRKPHR